MKLAILAEALFALSVLLSVANPRGFAASVLSSSGIEVLAVLYKASYAAGVGATYALVGLIAIAAQVRIAYSWFGRIPPAAAIAQVALGTLMTLSLLVAACWTAWWAAGDIWWWAVQWVPEDVVATVVAALPAAAGTVVAGTIALGTGGVRRGAPRLLIRRTFIQAGMPLMQAALYWAIRTEWLSGTIAAAPAGLLAGWLNIADLADAAFAGTLAIMLLRFSREFEDAGPPPRLGWRVLLLMTGPVALASALSLARCMQFDGNKPYLLGFYERSSWDGRIAQIAALVLVVSSTCWIIPWIYARDRRAWKAMLLGSAATIGVSPVTLLVLR